MQKTKKSKICTKCGIIKNLNDFHKDKWSKFGTKSSCKECRNVWQINWNNKNPGKAGAFALAWRKANPGKALAGVKQYQKANPAKVIASRRKHYRKNKNNPRFVLHARISSAIYRWLRGNKKGRRSEDLVGWTYSDIKNHFEKLFTFGMTWEKFLDGEIEIDHIVPVSVFNFTKLEHQDFKRCWSLSNLQPLWKADNRRKSNRLDKHFQPSLLF